LECVRAANVVLRRSFCLWCIHGISFFCVNCNYWRCAYELLERVEGFQWGSSVGGTPTDATSSFAIRLR
jgi:hypothetical protein